MGVMVLSGCRELFLSLENDVNTCLAVEGYIFLHILYASPKG